MLIFETERLTVRRYNQNDSDDFFRFTGNADVMRYIRPKINRQESDEFLLENIKLYDVHAAAGRWAALEKLTGSYIGSFSILVLDAEKNTFHIGYALLPEHWGMGYATELLKTGIGYFFTNHNGDELYAITQIENTASQHVLLKAGFTYQGVLERETDAWLYSLTRAQFFANGI